MNTYNNLVSVVLPAYNAEQYVGEAIESVLRQSYPYFEIVTINDASQDSTENVIKSFNDKRIKLVSHSKNLGPGAARNTAIDTARGRWIAILDADDKWHPDRLSELVKIAMESGDHFFISDDSLICFNTTAGLKPWGSQLSLYHKISFDEQIISLDLTGYYKLGCPCIKPLIPLSHIKNHKLAYDPICRMGEDLEFYCNLFRTGLELRLCKKTLYYYRLTPGSLSASKNKMEHHAGVYRRLLGQDGFTEKERELFRKSFQKLKNRQPYEEFSAALKLGHFGKAAYLAACKPRLVIDSLRSLPDSLRYRRAAWKHRGDVK